MSVQHVLLVEDNQIDAALFQKALKFACPAATVSVIPEVTSAVYYLRGINFYKDRTAHPFPYLVVIDLSLGSVSGMDLLKWIRQEPTMNGVLTLVLTASEEFKDAATAYEYGANAFLKKLHQVDPLVDSLKLLHEKWQVRGLYPPPTSTPPSA
jgi:DNA-binding response OmpR family regulator